MQPSDIIGFYEEAIKHPPDSNLLTLVCWYLIITMSVLSHTHYLGVPLVPLAMVLLQDLTPISWWLEFKQFHIGIHHDMHKVLNKYTWLPTYDFLCFSRFSL